MIDKSETDKLFDSVLPPRALPGAIPLDPTNWEDWATTYGEIVWTGESFSYPVTLDAYPTQLGTQPTAKSGIPGRASFSLPGQSQPYPDCGDDVLYLCPRCGHIKKGHRCCRRRTCPKCYTTWAWLQARRSALRILKARSIFASKLGRAHEVIHVMISLPRSAWALFYDDYPEARREAYRLLTKAGMTGALLIPHPWRLKCASCGGEIAGGWKKDKETGKFVPKERYCRDCRSQRFEWIDGPHFHSVGYGWVVRTREIEKDTGYIIKNIGVCNNVGGTIWYQLTHCGIQTGRQTVTYFGLCALNKYKSPKVPKELNLCPLCGAIMLAVEATDKPPPWT